MPKQGFRRCCKGAEQVGVSFFVHKTTISVEQGLRLSSKISRCYTHLPTHWYLRILVFSRRLQFSYFLKKGSTWYWKNRGSEYITHTRPRSQTLRGLKSLNLPRGIPNRVSDRIFFFRKILFKKSSTFAPGLGPSPGHAFSESIHSDIALDWPLYSSSGPYRLCGQKVWIFSPGGGGEKGRGCYRVPTQDNY